MKCSIRIDTAILTEFFAVVLVHMQTIQRVSSLQFDLKLNQKLIEISIKIK